MRQTVGATLSVVEAGDFAHPIGANADKLLQMRDDSRITRMVCNRDASTFDEWIDLDLLDIRTRDAWTDVKLIGKTAGSILTEQES